MSTPDEAMKVRRYGARLVTPAGPPSLLKELRIKLDMTQVEAAAWANQYLPCKHVTWVSWENGIRGAAPPPIIPRLMQILLARKPGGPWTPDQLDMLESLLMGVT